MSATKQPPRQPMSATLKPLALSLILSMSLTACNPSGTSRLGFLTPTFQSAELECLNRPRGQLPATATVEQVNDRIVDIDEAGEDCRQKLARARMKVEVFNEVVTEMNKKAKKD